MKVSQRLAACTPPSKAQVPDALILCPHTGNGVGSSSHFPWGQNPKTTGRTGNKSNWVTTKWWGFTAGAHLVLKHSWCGLMLHGLPSPVSAAVEEWSHMDYRFLLWETAMWFDKHQQSKSALYDKKKRASEKVHNGAERKQFAGLCSFKMGWCACCFASWCQGCIRRPMSGEEGSDTSFCCGHGDAGAFPADCKHRVCPQHLRWAMCLVEILYHIFHHPYSDFNLQLLCKHECNR